MSPAATERETRVRAREAGHTVLLKAVPKE